MIIRFKSIARRYGVAAAFALLATGVSTPVAAKSGADVYDSTCLVCHGLVTKPRSWYREGSDNKLVVVSPRGPTLSNIFGRPVGIVKTQKYSKGMLKFAETGAVWDRKTLDKFLTDSRAFVKGTFMLFKLETEDRKLVLDYLESIAPYKP